MRIQISARHCEIPDTTRNRTREMMESLTRYDPDVSSAEVVYEEEKHVRRVEVILSIDRSDPVVANGEGDEFREALDQVADRLRRMLRRQRSQKKDHQGTRLAEGLTSD